MLPRQGEMGENTPYTRNEGKRSLNYLGTLGTLERVTTQPKYVQTFVWS